jgi:hypothetical protein
VSTLMGLSGFDPTVRGQLALGSMLGLAASILMIVAYAWLAQRRRIGWNTLAVALIIGLLGQCMISGVNSLLSTGIEVLVLAYIMLQLRDSFAGE